MRDGLAGAQTCARPACRSNQMRGGQRWLHLRVLRVEPAAGQPRGQVRFELAKAVRRDRLCFDTEPALSSGEGGQRVEALLVGGDDEPALRLVLDRTAERLGRQLPPQSAGEQGQVE